MMLRKLLRIYRTEKRENRLEKADFLWENKVALWKN